MYPDHDLVSLYTTPIGKRGKIMHPGRFSKQPRPCEEVLVHDRSGMSPKEDVS
jgi:hypothetical protein